MAVENIIYIAVGTFLFCFALTFLFYGSKELYALIDTVKEESASKDGVALNRSDVNTDKLRNVVSYDELIGFLFSESLPCDVEINGREFDMENYDYMEADFAEILDTTYKREYQLNSNGHIIKIIFQSI